MGKLLFICGFPSGGTDLAKTILNAHPDIYINGEMPFLKNIVGWGYDQNTILAKPEDVGAFQDVLRRLDPWNNFENIDHDFGPDLRAQGSFTLEEVLRTCFSQNNTLVWGNKTPQNTENIELLYELFPNAHFLIVTRDVRDVCLSWRNKWGKDMSCCATKWATRMQKGKITTRLLPPERHLFVRFEDILSDTERCCRQVCTFLGLEFSERMLEHYKYTTEVIDGKINYGQRVDKRNRRKWDTQLPANTVRRIEEIAFGTMRALGYEVELATEERPITRWEIRRGMWRDFWATLLVGNRASQHNTLGHRFQTLLFELRKRQLKAV